MTATSTAAVRWRGAPAMLKIAVLEEERHRDLDVTHVDFTRKLMAAEASSQARCAKGTANVMNQARQKKKCP